MVKLLAVLSSNREYLADIVHRISIDVEDRGFDGLGKVGAVDSGAGLGGVGRETDLIVHNDVDGATNLIVGKVNHLHGLINDALASEGSITVNYEGYYSLSLLVTK